MGKRGGKEWDGERPLDYIGGARAQWQEAVDSVSEPYRTTLNEMFEAMSKQVIVTAFASGGVKGLVAGIFIGLIVALGIVLVSRVLL